MLTLLVILALTVLLQSRQPQTLSEGVQIRLDALDRTMGDMATAFRFEAQVMRDDTRGALSGQSQLIEGRLNTLDTRLNDFGVTQTDTLNGFRREASDGRSKLDEVLERNAAKLGEMQQNRLLETNKHVVDMSDRLVITMEKRGQEQRDGLIEVVAMVGALLTSNSDGQDKLRESVQVSLDKLQKDNAEKLDLMRQTVDEKLQGTLDKRLGESFQLVSEQLDKVHHGLGEMQTLANGVGDLKRVLTNVKSPGGWGEVQLGMLLEDMLTPDQFAANVRIRAESSEFVEFAVRLPGRSAPDQPLWLPIDAKFPLEDYERLLTAQESGAADDTERAGLALEKAVRLQAKTICDKYIHPPYSTISQYFICQPKACSPR